MLYRRILQGLGQLSAFLLDVPRAGEMSASASTIFRQVQNLAVQEEPWPVLDDSRMLQPPISTFAGPHHLATLLLAAGDILGASALSGVAPPPGVTEQAWRTLLDPIIVERPFLWPNHLSALDKGFLNPGTSAVVSFPTGAGKSTLSELKTAAALALGGAVVYLAPTHALVAQMKVDLAKAFPTVEVRDSLLVEDFYAEIGEKISPNRSQIVVMTPERCLALLLLDGGEFAEVKAVIFDECHLIHPNTSGHNRRSLDAMLALLHLHRAAPNADWLLLSAMMANASDLAAWVQDLTKRPCIALSLDWKPTRQARGCLVYDQEAVTTLKAQLKRQENATRATDGTIKAPKAAIQSTLQARPFGFFSLRQTWQTTAVEDYALLSLLDTTVPLSASITPKDPKNPKKKLYWYLAPNKNEVAAHLAARCADIGLKVLLFVQNTGHVSSIARRVESLIQGKRAAPQLSPRETELLKVATEEAGSDASVIIPSNSAACHYGLMLPPERELAERLFRRKDGISVLVATATLAQGMNLPADVVFIVGDERFVKETKGFSPLEAHELLNAAGRAGRAGHVAQGMVVVLPHQLVTFDPASHQISSGWMTLREAVFSRADQCLEVGDPIRLLLDRVHDAVAASDPEVSYFLRRVPRSLLGDVDAPRRFLRATFGAWQAKQQNQEAKFEEIITRTIAQQRELVPISQVGGWRDDLAARTGVAVGFIEALDAELLSIKPRLPREIEEWVRWYFSWLCDDEFRLESVFGHRLTMDAGNTWAQNDLFGRGLADTVWAWMSGETLMQLNVRCGGNSVNPGNCIKARKFVRLVPDLAFAAGLTTQVYREQLRETGEGRMPLTLGTLALCVREGVAEPEVAALRLFLTERPTSRPGLCTQWSEIRGFASQRDEHESFGRTRTRVERALTRYRS
jgi:hypothetical protein